MTDRKTEQQAGEQAAEQGAATADPKASEQQAESEQEYEYREVVPPEDEQGSGDPQEKDPVGILQRRLQEEMHARLAAEQRTRQWEDWHRQEQAKAARQPAHETTTGEDEGEESPALVRTLRSIQEQQEQLREANEQLRREVMESRTMMARMHINREVQEALTEVQKEHGRIVDAEDVTRVMRRNPDLSPKEAARVALRDRAGRMKEDGYVRRVAKPKPAPRVPAPHEFRSPPPFTAEPLTDRDKLGDRLGQIIDHIFPEEE